MMIKISYLKPLCAAAVILLAGCQPKNEPDGPKFKAALNDYYAGRQECVWANPMKFPAQADTANDSQTKSFDALTDAGLLTRQAQEKKRFLVGSKQVSNYDISDQGRAVWKADPAQPGYGNFCFGHREVVSVGTFTTAPGANGVNTATVNYQYQLAGVPAWAQSAEMKMAFPNIQAMLAPQSATSKLVQTQNGWAVTSE
jgi:hypothetical protein